MSIRGGQLEAVAERLYEALGAGDLLPGALQALAEASGDLPRKFIQRRLEPRGVLRPAARG